MKTLLVSLQKINFVHQSCNVLAGEKYHPVLRFSFGLVVMLVGVYIAKTIEHHPQEVISVAGDTIGYGVHGIGLIPFVEAILKSID